LSALESQQVASNTDARPERPAVACAVRAFSGVASASADPIGLASRIALSLFAGVLHLTG